MRLSRLNFSSFLVLSLVPAPRLLHSFLMCGGSCVEARVEGHVIVHVVSSRVDELVFPVLDCKV